MSRWRAGWTPLVAAAAVGLLGVAAFVASTGPGAGLSAQLRGANTPVNQGRGAAGNIDANNSPTLAQNPRRPAELAVANRIDTPDFSCALHVSGDRGARWSRVAVPIPPGEEPKCYAPDVAFAADGTLYMSYVTLRGNGNQPNAVWFVRSSDGGRTLSRPRRVSGPMAFQVRLAVDPARPRRVYLTWLQPSVVGISLLPESGNPIQVTRSDDRGETWNEPVRVSDPRRERVLAPAPTVGPDGTLYVLYLDVGDDRLDYQGAHDGLGGAPYAGRFSLVLGRSSDGGATWQESLVDDRVKPTRRFIVFLPPFPSVAVDRRSGRIFAAFEDASLSPSDVHVWSLSRGARRWEGPTRVNDTPAHDGTSQYLPKLAVAPDGRLDVAYYDRRLDPDNRFSDVSLQSSTDAGKTFSKHVTLTDRRFDSRIGAGSERGLPDLGSRLGLVSGESTVLAAWADTRAGTVGSNKQDIAFAAATVTRRAGLSAPALATLRYGGIALVLVAVALAFVVVRRRDRGGTWKVSWGG